MKKKRIIFAAALLLAMRLAGAEEGGMPAGDAVGSERLPETAEIKVTGLRHQASFDYAMFLKGVDVFAAHHDLAPAASLRFLVRDSKHAPLNDLKVAIVDEDKRQVLPVDSEDSFALPAAPDFKAAETWIVANRKSGTIEVSPRVSSPNIPEDQRRFGDLRLECEVMWAMSKDSAPLFVRMAAKVTAGVCRSPSIKLRKQLARRITSAQLVQGDRKESLPVVKGGFAYIPPLHDRSWSDDARVVLEYAR